MSLDDLLNIAISHNASDLHLVAGAPPHIRVYGELRPLDLPMLTIQDIEGMLYSILNKLQIEMLEHKRELDFSYSISSLARFRGNAMYERNNLSVVFRSIPLDIPDLRELGLPREVEKLCLLRSGLVLVVGPTGSGKSTTLAAMLDFINQTRNVNIITIEDPIEFIHRNHRSIVRQREVGSDTHSFSSALGHILRHDPDVILIGEMRDIDSISAALTAAETGHLVLSTVHTPTAALTISRIIDMYDIDKREQIRQQLANTIQAIISQRLIPCRRGYGRVLSTELMLSTPAIRNIIREGREYQLYTIIQTCTNMGMHTMDQALAKLYLEGKIEREVAFENCIDRKELERLIQINESF